MKIKHRILFLIVFLSLMNIPALMSQTQTSPFALDPLTDGIFIGSSIVINAASFLLEKNHPAYEARTLNKADINAFDRLVVKPYSHTLDITGDIFQYVSFLTPALLFSTASDQWLSIGAMYGEAVLISFGLKNILKALITRERPFMYYDNPPQKYIDDKDYLNSFPSGHTTMAFTGAAFVSYVFSVYFPDSPLKIPVIAGSFALATISGVLRVLSGNHFITDVLTGALIGSASGFLVPFLHRTRDGTQLRQSSKSAQGASVSVTPLSFVWTYRF